jgi:hypothetical protein
MRCPAFPRGRLVKAILAKSRGGTDGPVSARLVSYCDAWHGEGMTTSRNNRNVMAGGAPLAILTLAGPVVAGLLGYSPSIGFLVGLGLGVVIALAIWLAGSR